MASSSSSSHHPNVNCSKTQMCLFKILHTISSIPPPKEDSSPINNRGVGIDLNQELCSVEQSVELEPEASATDQGNISSNNQEGGEKSEEGVREESMETKVQSFEADNNGVGGETAPFAERGQDGNCLDLLIEAARVLADESEEEGQLGGAESRVSEEGRVVKKKQKERWGVVMDLYGDVLEDREPVVRSKRGRSQALPQRFRDSVVEPLKRRRRTVVKRYRE